MDLVEALWRLMAPRGAGAEISPGVWLRGVSAELGLRVRLEVDGAPLWVEVAPRAGGRRFAAETAQLGFAYRTEGGRSGVADERARAVCEAVAALAHPNEADVLATLRRAGASGEARVRHTRVTTALEQSGRSGSAEYYTLSPYVGCLIGCTYCYAHGVLEPARALLGLREAPWGSYVDVRENIAEVLAAELDVLEPHPIKFCPITSDPYHAIERTACLTRQCLTVIRDCSQEWPVLMLTRSALIERDLDLLSGLPKLIAGVSLPTLDDRVRQRFEPRAASVDERLGVLRALVRHGVRTLVVVQPILSEGLAEFADVLAELAGSVSLDVLRGEGGAEAAFDDHPTLRSRAWQEEAARELRGRLDRLGVPVWPDELPPDAAW